MGTPANSNDPKKRQSGTAPGSLQVEALFNELYAEIRSLAGNVFADQGKVHTLQPTALVNEIWIKLSGSINNVENRTHFFALAAKAMRQVLTDHARHAKREKRGGNAFRLTFSDNQFIAVGDEIDLVTFNDALEHLSTLNERHAKVAELRLLGSLSVQEIANLLDINERTVKRDWQAARLWLLGELYPS
ncbi:MAG: sigma-70 family RNA polymerase sigma factor [Phycisphaerales bacterium]|nr:sigma-70 family RNA polymerase sigma factor [Phycisphaerales bacterium]